MLPLLDFLMLIQILKLKKLKYTRFRLEKHHELDKH